MTNLKNKIFNIHSEKEFSDLALEIFHYQYLNNPVYKKYTDYLNINIRKINKITQIPFLPITFFKTHKILTGNYHTTFYFQSSGTSGQNRSKHFVANENIYIKSFIKTFNYFYGDFRDFCFLALLPSYLEQQHSSLVYMFNYFIKNTKCKESAFFLNDFPKLAKILDTLEAKGNKTILFGVSYALMDFAQYYNKSLKNTIVMETGGMKGKREEQTKEKLHAFLEKYFQTSIHSEYGMTELLSQSYSQHNRLFKTPPWKKILIRDRYDPFSFLPDNKIGGINIIDLANIFSCSFIETQDLGKQKTDGSFELHGRYDIADIRGCNLLIEP